MFSTPTTFCKVVDLLYELGTSGEWLRARPRLYSLLVGGMKQCVLSRPERKAGSFSALSTKQIAQELICS